MSTKDDGGPAFPLVELDRVTGNVCDQHFGMTLRDHFAGLAMQANLSVIREFPDETWRDGLAIDAYAMADAMLKARRQ